MKPLKLHTKTTLLTSTITVAVLVTTLLTISVRVIRLIHEDQRELADLQAVNLADHITQQPAIHTDQDLLRVLLLVSSGHPHITGVRLWKRSSDTFIEQIATPDSPVVEAVPASVVSLIQQGKVAGITRPDDDQVRSSLYHAYAPITQQRQITGMVEVIERLDDFPEVAVNYGQNALWLALAAVTLIALSIYLLFRYFVYQPIESLIEVIARARGGELDAQAALRRGDEIGTLAQEFNSMLGEIHEMTSERERQQEVLKQRVREATNELQERNEQLELTNLELWRTSRRLLQLERLAAAEQTAAKFAHEVGTPLNLISCHVQLLRDELSHNPEAAEARTEIISEQIDRIERIVRQMLDRTSAEAAELAPLDLNALLRRIVDATAPMLESRGVHCSASLAEPLPLIAGNTDRLQQVFINLINNAVDAMPEGGELHISSKLNAGCQGSDPHIFVEVADNGCGMDTETTAHIFDPLYTTKERGKGSGLGLVIVSQVMDEHDGGIEVISEPGQGTRFVLRFPVTLIETAKV